MIIKLFIKIHELICGSNKPTMNTIPCAGIIVFDGDKTILVNTDVGNFSFPKGGRESLETPQTVVQRKEKRNKAIFETPIQTAWRELKEETGLTKEHVELISEDPIDELSNKGFPSVRYFVGYLVKKLDQITFDRKELANVDWYDVEKALKIEKFKDARKKILAEAFSRYKSFVQMRGSSANDNSMTIKI